MVEIPIDSHIVLRLFEMHHAPVLLELIDANRQYLRAWLTWVDGHRTIDVTQQFIQNSLQQYAEKKGLVAGLWVEEALVGAIGLRNIDVADRHTEIGYWLAEKFMGKGLMTRACAGLIDYAFTQLNLNRIEIQCATDNTQSCAIPERLDFTCEGILREVQWLNGKYVDHTLYSLLRREWSNEGFE